MDKELFKQLLNNEFYKKFRGVITDDVLAEEFRPIYSCIKEMQDKYDRDLTIKELWLYYLESNPTLTQSRKVDAQSLFKSIKDCDDVDLDIAEDLVNKFIVRNLQERLATQVLLQSQTGDASTNQIETITDKIKELQSGTSRVTYVTTDVDEMLDQVTGKYRWKWNYNPLQIVLGNIGEGVLGVVSARPDCFDDKTEILTENGWVLFKDLTRKEKVAQVLDDKSIEFVKPISYIDKNYEGEMVSFKQSQGRIDLLVTPNHDMVLENKYGELVKIKAKDPISTTHKYIHSGNKKGFNFNLTDYQRFLIAYQADGSAARKGCTGERGHFTVRFSFKKERKVKRLLEILFKARLSYKVVKEKSKKDYTTIYVKCKEHPSKTFNWVNLNKVTRSWGKKFVEELSYWDATRRSNTRIKYDTTVKENADIIASICALSGMQCNHSVLQDNRSDKFSDIHSLSILTTRNFSGASSVNRSVVNYKGKVYCVAVPSGRIIVRRNNKVAVVGNCGKTAFYVSCVYGQGGWLDQGAKVHIICNEEPAVRTQVRGVSCYTEIPNNELIENKNIAKAKFSKIKDNIFVQDKVDMSVEELDAYVNQSDVDILIIDQLDKLSVRGMFNRSDEKLRSLYTACREIAKRYNIAVIAITQAGAGAAGKLHYGFEELDGSKTGKAAEADFVLCIGMNDISNNQGVDDYYRCINTPKNKLTGRKQNVFYTLNPNLSKIEES